MKASEVEEVLIFLRDHQPLTERENEAVIESINLISVLRSHIGDIDLSGKYNA